MTMKTMKRKALGLITTSAALAASVVPASAAIDITDVTAEITAAEGHATTIAMAGIGLAVLFLGFKLVKRAIAKV